MSLHSARLYLCTDSRQEQGDFEEFVDAAYAGGVDIIQLRDKHIPAGQELELLAVLRSIAARHGRLFAVYDRADIAALSGAPVFHVGQQDLPPAAARQLLEPDVVVGLSTRSPQQAAAAMDASDLGYFCTGPLWATPTKPGRAAVGLELVRSTAGREQTQASEGLTGNRGSPSAGSTTRTSLKWSTPVHPAPSSSVPLPTPRIQRMRHAGCSQSCRRADSLLLRGQFQGVHPL